MTHPLIYPSYGTGDHEHVFSEQSVAKIAQLLGEPKAEPLLSSVAVFVEGQEMVIPLQSEMPVKGDWQLTTEYASGHFQGKIYQNSIVLPAKLPLGYHELAVSIAEETHQCRVIITPKQAYQPKEIQEKQKLWGAILQLYTLRSQRNWGIGDFSDLCEFLVKISQKGGDFVGLNPIHALFPANPESASPYSPSSRLWQNIIYIDVNAVEAFQQSCQAQKWFESEQTQSRLKALRRRDYIDYTEVTRLKLEGLRLAFDYFSQHQNQKEFEEFIALNRQSLTEQATFDALHQWLSEQADEQWGWNYWAEQYHNYQNASVQQFQCEHADLVHFYMWLQFLANQQLAHCHEVAQKLGMPIGFYRDLAVGVANNGAETWADKSLFVLGASVGAPPDMMAPQGQNWGLSPMHPQILRERGYQPFVDLLRANMQHCGALRIDHILGFMRLWWVADGDSADNGVYVKYPLADLLAILALESQRHRCLIIAEALGTVPEGILPALEEKGILAYNLFYFEDENNGAKPLSHYAYQAMTTLSTHDLPTVRGYWQGYDFELGEKYGVYPSQEVLNYSQQDRIRRKTNIRQAIEDEGIALEADSEQMSMAFTHALQKFAAHTNSALFGTQPEDWLNMLEPVNIPGTGSEYPNWRRKLAKTTKALFADKNVDELLGEIERVRPPQTCKRSKSK